MTRWRRPLAKKQVLTPNEHREAVETYGAANFKVGMGAESIKELLMEVDLEKEAEQLKKDAGKSYGTKNASGQSNVLKSSSPSARSGNKPEWMVLDVLPVIPSGAATYGSAGRRQIRDKRPQRPLPSAL